MQWTRATWPVTFDLVAYGVVLLAIVAAAGVWRRFGR